MKENRGKTLPAFKSVDEFVAFFETHDMGDYLENMPEVQFEINIKKRKAKTNTGNTPTRVIGLKLGRTEHAVRTKASEKGVSLKSRNHSSVYRRKK